MAIGDSQTIILTATADFQPAAGEVWEVKGILIETAAASSATVTITDGASVFCFMYAGASWCTSWGCFGGRDQTGSSSNGFYGIITDSYSVGANRDGNLTATSLYSCAPFTITNGIYLAVTIVGTADVMISAVEVQN